MSLDQFGTRLEHIERLTLKITTPPYSRGKFASLTARYKMHERLPHSCKMEGQGSLSENSTFASFFHILDVIFEQG